MSRSLAKSRKAVAMKSSKEKCKKREQSAKVNGKKDVGGSSTVTSAHWPHPTCSPILPVHPVHLPSLFSSTSPVHPVLPVAQSCSFVTLWLSTLLCLSAPKSQPCLVYWLIYLIFTYRMAANMLQHHVYYLLPVLRATATVGMYCKSHFQVTIHLLISLLHLLVHPQNLCFLVQLVNLFTWFLLTVWQLTCHGVRSIICCQHWEQPLQWASVSLIVSQYIY